MTSTERQSRPRVRKTPPPPPSRPVTRGYSRPYVVGPRASVEPPYLSSPIQRAQTVAPSMTTTSSRHSGHAHTRWNVSLLILGLTYMFCFTFRSCILQKFNKYNDAQSTNTIKNYCLRSLWTYNVIDCSTLLLYRLQTSIFFRNSLSSMRRFYSRFSQRYL